jgi:hypothetical protein
MWKILIISFIVITIAAVFSLNRFGFTISGLLTGDGDAVLQAATALMGTWSLVMGFSITAIGATFEVSKLPASWKFSVFRKTVLRKLIPFFILSLLGGVIPFWGILHCRIDIGVYFSNVTPWLIVGFILQLLLVISAAVAAKTAYKEMTLVPAIRNTLSYFDDTTLIALDNAHKAAFKVDYDEGNRAAIIPFFGYGSGIKGSASDAHDELVLIFTSLFLETDPHKLDDGFRAISEWMKSNSIEKIDGYLQYRLLPICFHSLRTDPNTFNAQFFTTRLFYVARLINRLKKAGATLSASNSANPFWNLIEDYSYTVGMSRALEAAKMGIDCILSLEYKLGSGIEILITNLSKSIQRLALEHNAQSLYVMEWILECYINYIQLCLFRIWPVARHAIEHMIPAIELMYEAINTEYSDNAALWAGMHDMRYWILVLIRRTQEAFVDLHKPSVINKDHKEFAREDYEIFNKVIAKLLKIRRPIGDESAYGNFEHKENPYTLNTNP